VDNTDRVIRISVRVGSRLDPVQSAQGQVFCAWLRPEEVAGLPRALKRDPELRAEIDAVRRAGVSVNVPAVNGVRTLAAPVFQGPALVGSVAIVGTTVSIEPDVHSPMAAALVQTAKEISAHLGTEDPAPTA
jgi:DNA-binding IclR family transcriptional regulator